ASDSAPGGGVDSGGDASHEPMVSPARSRQRATWSAANSFEQALKSNEAVAKAKVKSGPFVVALGKDDARTFTVVSQTISGKSAPQGETRNVRVESILVRTPPGWRVDWVQIS